jgi:hypothetical protein
MTKLEILVKGEEWTIYYEATQKAFKSKFKDSGEAAAITNIVTRYIYFQPGYTDLPTIIHELVHAYYSTLCLHSASIEADQMEEIFCEMFAHNGKEILKQAYTVQKFLREVAK